MVNSLFKAFPIEVSKAITPAHLGIHARQVVPQQIQATPSELHKENLKLLNHDNLINHTKDQENRRLKSFTDLNLRIKGWFGLEVAQNHRVKMQNLM